MLCGTIEHPGEACQTPKTRLEATLQCWYNWWIEEVQIYLQSDPRAEPRDSLRKAKLIMLYNQLDLRLKAHYEYFRTTIIPRPVQIPTVIYA